MNICVPIILLVHLQIVCHLILHSTDIFGSFDSFDTPYSRRIKAWDYGKTTFSNNGNQHWKSRTQLCHSDFKLTWVVLFSCVCVFVCVYVYVCVCVGEGWGEGGWGNSGRQHSQYIFLFFPENKAEQFSQLFPKKEKTIWNAKLFFSGKNKKKTPDLTDWIMWSTHSHFLSFLNIFCHKIGFVILCILSPQELWHFCPGKFAWNVKCVRRQIASTDKP